MCVSKCDGMGASASVCICVCVCGCMCMCLDLCAGGMYVCPWVFVCVILILCVSVWVNWFEPVRGSVGEFECHCVSIYDCKCVRLRRP